MMRLQEHGIVSSLPLHGGERSYPEPDPAEPGFAVGYSKNDMNDKPALITFQQRYLTQFMARTKTVTLGNSLVATQIIAFELFNEPKHRHPPQRMRRYIEALIKTVKGIRCCEAFVL